MTAERDGWSQLIVAVRDIHTALEDGARDRLLGEPDTDTCAFSTIDPDSVSGCEL